MRRPAGWKAAAGAVLLVVILGVCLPALAEASSPSTHPLCTAATGEQLSPASKAPPPDLWAVPVGDTSPVAALSLSGCLPPDPSPARVSEDLGGDLSPRAPPVRL